MSAEKTAAALLGTAQQHTHKYTHTSQSLLHPAQFLTPDPTHDHRQYTEPFAGFTAIGRAFCSQHPPFSLALAHRQSSRPSIHLKQTGNTNISFPLKYIRY